MEESRKATAGQVRTFFEYKSAKAFMKDWKALSDEEKEYFKVAVGEEVNY